MKAIKILFIVDSLHIGGTERQLIELLKGLSVYKDIICELGVMSEEIHFHAVETLNVKVHYLIRKKSKDPRIFLKLHKLCKEFQPDIVHSWSSMASVYAALITKIIGNKLINAMIRGAKPLKFFNKQYIRSIITFPFSDIIVANSQAGLREYRVSANKGVCIYNGFDFDRLKNLKAKELVRRKYKIYKEKVVGMVASFSEYKDYETYIAAATIILGSRDDVTFMAVGDGVKIKECKNNIEDMYLGKIIFTGYQEDIESIINIFDIGVLSSNIQEGIPNSIMEYMVLGKPVVATTGGGTNEIIVGNQTGYLIPGKSPHDLVRKINYLLDNPNKAKQMGEAGRKRIQEKFCLDVMTSKYVALYKDILRGEN